MISTLDSKKDRIVEMYQEGIACSTIKKELEIQVTTRSIQRYLNKLGLIRDRYEAMRLPECRERHSENTRASWNGYLENKSRRSIITPSTRWKVLKRDKFKCVLCGCGASENRRLEVDHIKPLWTGGNNNLSNYRTLCNVCNVGRNGDIRDR